MNRIVENEMPNDSILSHITQLRAAERDWHEVYHDSNTSSPFLSFEFVTFWYECFTKPDRIRVYVAKEGDRVIGFLPLHLEHAHHFRILRSLTNDHCFHSGPLVRRNYEQQFRQIVLHDLRMTQQAWDVLWYKFSYSFSQFPMLFPGDMLEEQGFRWIHDTQPTYTVLLDKAFHDYAKVDLSSNTRKTVMRCKNRLARQGTYALRRYEGDAALERWPDFVRIEDSGWKGAAGTSIRRLGPDYSLYYEKLVRMLAGKQVIHLYFLELNDTPIAGVFGYIEGDTFHWAKTAYDEQFKEFSPSNILTLHIIEELTVAFPNIKRFHMFPWDYDYKHRFVNCESFCNDLLLFGNTVRGKIWRHFFGYKTKLRSFLR